MEMQETVTTTDAVEQPSIPSSRIDFPAIARLGRAVISVIALLSFGLNLALAQWSIADARDADASAIQIIQVWTPHIYYAVVIVGIAVVLYILTRAFD